MKHLFAILLFVSINEPLYSQTRQLQPEQIIEKEGSRKLSELIKPN